MQRPREASLNASQHLARDMSDNTPVEAQSTRIRRTGDAVHAGLDVMLSEQRRAGHAASSPQAQP
jgi:hypothetical protein